MKLRENTTAEINLVIFWRQTRYFKINFFSPKPYFSQPKIFFKMNFFLEELYELKKEVTKG